MTSTITNKNKLLFLLGHYGFPHESINAMCVTDQSDTTMKAINNDLTYYDVISERLKSWIWGLIGRRGIKGWALSQFCSFTGSKRDDINKRILPIIIVKKKVTLLDLCSSNIQTKYVLTRKCEMKPEGGSINSYRWGDSKADSQYFEFWLSA